MIVTTTCCYYYWKKYSDKWFLWFFWLGSVVIISKISKYCMDFFNVIFEFRFIVNVFFAIMEFIGISFLLFVMVRDCIKNKNKQK